jgi:saccharopine dehydrogenase (NAD+, L-lysine-forming)
MSINLHLRSETGKALEHRSALTPTTTKTLIDAGFKINVERSPQRIFDDEEFERVGATLVAENSWPDAPEDHIIIGLKELAVETCESIDANRLQMFWLMFQIVPLKHVHVQFAHCYKQQKDWDTVLARYARGNG